MPSAPSVSEQQLASDQLLGAFDDLGQGDGPLGPQGLGEPLEEAGHQSSRSTKTRMVPPQVNPTANASSSE